MVKSLAVYVGSAVSGMILRLRSFCLDASLHHCLLIHDRQRFLHQIINQVTLAANLVDADGIHEETIPDQGAKLARVEFGDDDGPEITQDVTKITGERIEITQMSGADAMTSLAKVVAGGGCHRHQQGSRQGLPG